MTLTRVSAVATRARAFRRRRCTLARRRRSPRAERRARVAGATIVRQVDARRSLVGVTLVVRAGLDRQTMKQNGLAALVAADDPAHARTGERSRRCRSKMRSPRAAARSTSRSIPSDVRFYVEALADDAPAVLDLLRTAIAAPDFSPGDGTRRARGADATQIAAERSRSHCKSASTCSMQASSPQANAGLPELGTPASLAQLVPDRCADVLPRLLSPRRRARERRRPARRARSRRALHSCRRACRRQHVGGRRCTCRRSAGRRTRSSRIATSPRRGSSPSIRRRVVDSRDFGPMLVLAAFLRRTLSDIAQVPGVVSPTFASRSVGAVYAYDRVAAAPRALRQRRPDRQSEPRLRDGALRRQRARRDAAAGFDRRVQGGSRRRFRRPTRRRWKRAPGSPQSSRSESSSPDFINRALAAIAATTPDDVQRVARTYLGNPTIALVLPRGTNLARLNVALVHDYLNQRGGAERVFARIARAWPDAPIYTALYDERVTGDLIAAKAARAHVVSRRAFRSQTASFARSRRSIRAHSKRSISPATTRSSARRPPGRRACSIPPRCSRTSATSTRSAVSHSRTTSTSARWLRCAHWRGR